MQLFYMSRPESAPTLKKILTIMRLTAFVLIVFSLNISATVYSQKTKLSLEVNNKSIKEVLFQIENQTEFRFIFESGKVDLNKKVSIQAKEQTVEAILDNIFEHEGIHYEITENNLILINPSETDNSRPAAKPTVNQQNKRQVTGVVVDERGDPVIGANVIEKGTTNGSITDVDGNFFLNMPENATLQISYIGYINQEIKVTNQESLRIVLREDAQALDEVVVIGYGTVRKKDLTGSVVQIKPSKLLTESPSTIQDVLRGTAGLNVGMSNDAKGGGTLNIRGQRSVYVTDKDNPQNDTHNTPLIILDGMHFYGELSEINIDNIAQIDVLKDASAAAVYGAQAANGVIIVTTKKGSQGAPKVSATINYGFTTRADYERMFTTEEYIQHKVDYFEGQTYGYDPNQANINNGWVPYQSGQTNPGYYRSPNNLPAGVSLDQWRGYTSNGEQSDQEIWLRRINFKGNALENALAGKVVDWDDYVYRTGFQQDYNVNIGGATEKASYFFSGGFMNNEGVMRGDDYRTVRLAMRTNMEVANWLEFGASVNFQDRTDGRNLDPNGMQQYSPFADDVDENGNWYQYILTDPEYTQRPTSPYFSSQYTELEKGYQVLNSQFNVKVKLPFNINYQFNISPRYQFFYDRYFMSADLPGSNPSNRGVNREQGKNFDWSLNNILTWQQTFNKVHDLTLTLVQEAEERMYWKDRMEARNILPTDALGFHNVSGATMNESKMEVTDTHQTADALLARAQYNYDSRYLLTASVRRDGYCAFGANYPYATFPAVALAWVFTNEKFWDWNHIMDYGKLRLSWGKNGNRSLRDPYIALSNLTTGQYANYNHGGGNTYDMVYLRVDRLGNPNLQWEKSTAYNAALDFGFLDNRISGSVEYYLTETKDMIMEERLPGFSGFDKITTNLGQVNNSGFELTINTINIKNQNFTWNTSFALSYNKNEIKHLYGDYDENGKEADDRTNKWFIGQAIDEIWDYKVTGIWQTDEREEAAIYGQRPGDPKIWNNPDNDIRNADGTTTVYYDDDDKQFLGKRVAPFRLSMRNDFTIFKNFTVGVSLYSFLGWKDARNGVLNYDAFMNRDNDGGFLLYRMQNQPWKRYWTPENAYNDVARIDATGTGGADHPRLYVNRNFLRIDNLSVSYNVPKSVISKLNLSSLRVYGNVKNLTNFHSSEWYYGDPENMSHSTRTFNLGLNVEF